jgi:hypothetical protein
MPKNHPKNHPPSSGDSEASKLCDVAQAQLNSVPLLRKCNMTKEIKVPSVLQLSGESKGAMEAHLNSVGIDYHRFTHTIEEQSEFLIVLRIYVLGSHVSGRSSL